MQDTLQKQRGKTATTTAHLKLWDVVSIILGIVIGAGIYETAPFVFKCVPNAWAVMGVWAFGGVLCLVGALCYAELACAYPRSGGDYVYLTRAYGPWAGFLFGWAQLVVLMTGSIGMMAFIFADYASKLWNQDTAVSFVYAGLAVVVFSLFNLAGVVFGKRTQNLLTLAKVAGIGAVLAAGFFWSGEVTPSAPQTASGSFSFGLALILVLYTYGGWNDAAFVVAEVTDKPRNIPRALVMGILLLTAIYLAVNGAYLCGLGLEAASGSKAIAADVLQRPLGGWGAKGMSVLVMISALGALNGLIYTGSRIYAVAGEDFRAFALLARWHPRLGTPAWSIIAQAAITLVLIVLVGTAPGRSAISFVLLNMGLGSVSWEGHGGFETLLRCTAPVFWFFFLLTGCSLLVLRWRDPDRERPFRTPGYPVVPLVFCGTCAFMLYSSIDYAGKLTFVGAIPLVLGLLVFVLQGNVKSQ